MGVVADVRAYDLQRDVPEWINGTIYVPYGPKATMEGGRVPSDMTLAIQTRLAESQVRDVLRLSIQSSNSEVPIVEVKSMNAIVSESVSTPGSTTFLFAAFAALALVLGVVGIYGVLSFLVSGAREKLGFDWPWVRRATTSCCWL